MIIAERTVKVSEGLSTIDEPVVLYRGDRNVEVQFKIINPKLKFTKQGNIIESTEAFYGQLAIINPNGNNAFTEIAETKDGEVVFEITAEMIDQLEEVGLYSFHIRLFDESQDSRISLPPIVDGIEIREPIAIEGGSPQVVNTVGGAEVGKSVAEVETVALGDTFDSEGKYNKTTWRTGDRITEAKLNKIEDALDGISVRKGNVDLTDYAKASDIPFKTSQLINDSGFATQDDLKAIDISLRDDEADTEEASVKLAKAVMAIALNKPTAQRYTITYKYMCDGATIKADDTEIVEEGTTKVFSVASAPTIEGYTPVSASPTSAKIEGDMTVTYTYAVKEVVEPPTEPDHTHSYTEAITKQATCTEDGVKTFTCSCEHSYTTVIPKLGHNYVDNVCTNCGDELPVEPPAEPELPDPVDGVLDITSLFDFTKHTKMIMNLGSVTGTTGTFKTSSYFDSAVADLSAYAGKTIKITIPAYNSGTGVNACNCTCLVNDNYPTATNPSLKTILHRWEVYSEDTSVKALGEYREYTIVLPSNTKYFLTTAFNPTNLDKCVGSTEFYCKVIM